MLGLALGLFVVASSAATPPDPLAALSAPERRMLDPLRERALGAEALVDSLGLHPDAQVADVGAGPGVFTLKLARRVPRGRVLATDLDAAALRAVTARAAEAGLTNIAVQQVTATDPGLARAAFDVIFLCQVDHYLADRAAYFRALRLALKPTGQLVVVNGLPHRSAALAAVRAAGFATVREAVAPPGHFMMFCTP